MIKIYIGVKFQQTILRFSECSLTLFSKRQQDFSTNINFPSFMRRICFALSHFFNKRFSSKQTKYNNINCNKNCLICFSVSLPFDNLLHIPTWDQAMSCTFISVLLFLKVLFYEKTTTQGGRWLKKIKSILNEWLGKPQVSAFNNTRCFYRKMEKKLHSYEPYMIVYHY